MLVEIFKLEKSKKNFMLVEIFVLKKKSKRIWCRWEVFN